MTQEEIEELVLELNKIGVSKKQGAVQLLYTIPTSPERMCLGNWP